LFSEETQQLREQGELYLKIEPLLCDAWRAAEIAEDAAVNLKEYAVFAVCRLSMRR
jgi:hypothetical protein